MIFSTHINANEWVRSVVSRHFLPQSRGGSFKTQFLRPSGEWPFGGVKTGAGGNSMGQMGQRVRMAEHPFMPVRTSFHVCLGVVTPVASWCSMVQRDAHGATVRQRDVGFAFCA